jgi:hypothetical protein
VAQHVSEIAESAKRKFGAIGLRLGHVNCTGVLYLPRTASGNNAVLICLSV